MQFLRLAAMFLVALAIAYAGIYFYLRAARRERLERDYSDAATERERTAFVQSALNAYSSRMARWLAILVFGVPISGLALVVYVTNFM